MLSRFVSELQVVLEFHPRGAAPELAAVERGDLALRARFRSPGEAPGSTQGRSLIDGTTSAPTLAYAGPSLVSRSKKRTTLPLRAIWQQVVDSMLGYARITSGCNTTVNVP
jgi:hypothetical protein